MHFDTKFPSLVYTRLLFFVPVRSSMDVCLYSLLTDLYSEVGTTNHSPQEFGQLESAFTGGIQYSVDSQTNRLEVVANYQCVTAN